MSGWTKHGVIGLLAEQKKWDAQTRETLFALVGDSSPLCRQRAVEVLGKCKIEEAEAQELEALLKRRAQDLRRGLLSLLLQQKDAAALASAERLLNAKDGGQRLAGLEMLRELAVAKRLRDLCRTCAERFRQDRARLSAEEEKALSAIVEVGSEKPMLDNALGLLHLNDLARPIAPRKRCDLCVTPAAIALVEALDALVHEHREDQVVLVPRPQKQSDDEIYNPYLDGIATPETRSDPQPILFANLGYSFPWPDPKLSAAEDEKYLPLAPVWRKWWENRPPGTHDKDGFEAFRAAGMLTHRQNDIHSELHSTAAKTAFAALHGDRLCKELSYGPTVKMLLAWRLRLNPPKGAVDFLLDAVETSYAAVPKEELAKVRTAAQRQRWSNEYVSDWRDSFRDHYVLWYQTAQAHRSFCPNDWKPPHHVRMFRLQNWKDRSVPGIGRFRPSLQEILAAYGAKGASRADIIDAILGPPDAGAYSSREFPHLSELTARRTRTKWLTDIPELRELADACRDRILEIELARGDTETAASGPALAIASVWGIDNLVRILNCARQGSFP